MLVLESIYAYALAGFIAGWIGSNLVTPSTAANWSPAEHSTTMLMCKKVCGDKVQSYDILSGECKCQRSK